MKDSIFKLNSKQIEHLLKYFSPIHYTVGAHLIYKGQIPFFGLILLDGRVKIISKKKEEPLAVGSVIGLRELFESRPFPNDLYIKKNTTIITVDKSGINEMLEYGRRDSQLKSLFTEILCLKTEQVS